jgi:hypothetical protein
MSDIQLTERQEAAVILGLKRVRQLLARTGGWVQGRSVIRRPALQETEVEYAFCLIGAVDFVFGSRYNEIGLTYQEYGRARRVALNSIMECIGTDLIPYWNDRSGRTQDEVVAALDCAVAKAREVGHVSVH